MHILDDFVSLLPERPYVAPRKGVSLIVGRDRAVEYPLVQPNHPYLKRFIALDLDRPDSVLAWEEIGLPPNLAVENPQNGHAHYLWLLERPIWIKPDAPISRPLNYLQAVRRGLISGLRGDPGYSGNLVKNPLHEDWRAHVFRNEPYRLGDIAKHVDLSVRPADFFDPESRNWTLFNHLRQWAYQHRRKYTSVVAWKRDVLSMACSLNKFDQKGPLSYAEVKCIAKSVANWVWTNYHGSGQTHRTNNPGIMQLRNSDIPVSERYRMGQRYAAELQTAQTRAALVASVRALEAIGEKVTQKTVAAHSGKGIATVKRHWKKVSSSIR